MPVLRNDGHFASFLEILENPELGKAIYHSKLPWGYCALHSYHYYSFADTEFHWKLLHDGTKGMPLICGYPMKSGVCCTEYFHSKTSLLQHKRHSAHIRKKLSSRVAGQSAANVKKSKKRTKNAEMAKSAKANDIPSPKRKAECRAEYALQRLKKRKKSTLPIGSEVSVYYDDLAISFVGVVDGLFKNDYYEITWHDKCEGIEYVQLAPQHCTQDENDVDRWHIVRVES